MCPRPEPGSVESGVQVTRCRPLPRRSLLFHSHELRSGGPRRETRSWLIYSGRGHGTYPTRQVRRRVVYQLWLKKRRVSEWFTRQETCSRCKHTATALACGYWYVYLSPLVSNARAVPPPPFRPIPGAGGTRSMNESLPTPSSTCFVPTICEGRAVPEDNLERASRDPGKGKTSPTVIFVENHPSVDSAFVLFIHCFCLFCRAKFNLAPTYSRVQGRAQYRYLCRNLSCMPSRWETRGSERADTAVRCSRYNGPLGLLWFCVFVANDPLQHVLPGIAVVRRRTRTF